MPKSASENVADFLLGLVPDLLPKPFDSAAKSVVDTFKDQLDALLAEPRLKRELLEATRQAELNFRTEAPRQLKNADLVEAVASFPLFDRDLFQNTLGDLPNHVDEDYLANDLQGLITDDWKGKFTPAELREGVAIYLNCLRVQLLKVDGFSEIVTQLATLRTDVRTEQILAIVKELANMVKIILERLSTPTATVATGLFTIPAPVTDFTGREKELAQLKENFSRGTLISGVSGGGGVGKTELARKLAQDIADSFPDARMNIDLLGTLEKPLAPDDAMRRILEPFYPGKKLPDNLSQLKDLYQQTFSNHKVLLMLDNAADVTQVRSLIPPAPSAAIITSRQHFTLSEFVLLPLRLDVLSPEQARDFLQIASPKLNKATDTDVDALANLCGRLPLALRVAVSLLNDRDDWTLAILLKRLEDERTRLKFLKREKDLDVEATLNLSYDQLGDLQKPFRYLGVFPSPFFELSADVVWDIYDKNISDEIIGKLVNRSLVNFIPISQVEGGLFTLHDLTRLYAVERLLENKDEAEEALIRHAQQYLLLAGLADDDFEKGNENIRVGLNKFILIWPHLSIARERLLPEQKVWPQTQMADEWLSLLPGICPNVLNLYLPPRQKIPIFQSALESSRRLGNKMREGLNLNYLGSAYTVQGDVYKAIKSYEQHLAIAREIGDHQGEGAVLCNLGYCYITLGNPTKAIEFYEPALAINRDIGNRRWEGAALGGLGLAYAALSDVRKAIEFHEQDLGIEHEIGNRQGEGNALGNLGNAFLNLGDTPKAIEFYEQALIFAREVGDNQSEVTSLGNLGNAHIILGDARKGIEFNEQALASARELGDRRSEGNNLFNLGLAYAVLGNTRKAIEYFEKRIDIAHEIGDRQGEILGNWNLGLAYEKLGEIDKAIIAIKNCIGYEQKIKDPNAEKHIAYVEELQSRQK